MAVGNSKDYRNTDKCLSLSDVAGKKNSLDQRIRKEHKKAKIMYNLIKDKQGDYFNDFAQIYNYKCAYCGASIKFIDFRLFEVDHFVCESSFSDDTNGRIEAGKVNNLAFSCYSCNRGKGSLPIKTDYQVILNPDDNSIANVFSRDEKYYINVNDCYLENSFIQLFYDKLLLGSESRRLDFLLLEMDNLIAQLQVNNQKLADKLEQCKGRLLQKKNYPPGTHDKRLKDT